MATARVLAAIPIEIGVVAIGASIAISISIGVAVLFERWKKRQTLGEILSEKAARAFYRF